MVKSTKALFFHALGDDIRLEIIKILLKEEQCTCVCKILSRIKRDQSVIFRHIKILEKAGILDTNKSGKYRMFCLKDKNRIKKLLEE